MANRGFRFLDPPTPEEEVLRVLQVLADGSYVPETLEGTAIDLKEDASRRNQTTGAIQEGRRRPDNVAGKLAQDAACFANTPGGGALIVGVCDKTGEIFGTDIDVNWLRSRIHELTNGKMGAIVREVEMVDNRVLVVIVPQAVEPVSVKGKYRHRQGDRCVEISSSRLLQGRFADAAADPSFMESTTRIDEVSDRAMTMLCDLAKQAVPSRANLNATEVVSRLGIRHGDTEYLNKAGEILLAKRPRPAIDYTYREVQGGPSTVRIDQAGRSLLEEIDAVETEARRHNPTTEIQTGFVVRRISYIPDRTLREVILNGVCHRDWNDPEPTAVEHVGSELRVTSPGGFIRDITPENVLIRNEPRYRTLMNAVRGLGLVEQEGVGVDRMFADMIRIGADLPIIEELPRPAVRVVLAGQQPSHNQFQFFAQVVPADGFDDADFALAVYRAATPDRPYLTARSCRTLLQRSGEEETLNVLNRVTSSYSIEGNARVFDLIRTQNSAHPAWQLSRPAQGVLGFGWAANPWIPARAWVEERGRISAPEYQALTGLSGPTAVKHLKELAAEDGLIPSTASGRGRGFHYINRGQKS